MSSPEGGGTGNGGRDARKCSREQAKQEAHGPAKHVKAANLVAACNTIRATMAKGKAAEAAAISGVNTGALDNEVQMVAGGDEEDVWRARRRRDQAY